MCGLEQVELHIVTTNERERERKRERERVQSKQKLLKGVEETDSGWEETAETLHQHTRISGRTIPIRNKINK